MERKLFELSPCLLIYFTTIVSSSSSSTIVTFLLYTISYIGSDASMHSFSFRNRFFKQNSFHQALALLLAFVLRHSFYFTVSLTDIVCTFSSVDHTLSVSFRLTIRKQIWVCVFKLSTRTYFSHEGFVTFEDWLVTVGGRKNHVIFLTRPIYRAAHCWMVLAANN